MNGPVSRPLMRWHGGKWLLAPWIVSLMPPHRVYVEPYGGAASVLLTKPRSYSEVYNDLDGEIVNVFRVLRDPAKAARLVELLSLTPYAREDFVEATQRSEDPVEDARRMIARSFMGFGSNAHNRDRSTGFRANSNRSGTTPAHDWQRYPAGLVATIERLRGVVIENRQASEVMRAHDGPATLHYLDPPYAHETRTDSSLRQGYACEMTDADHVVMIEQALGLAGLVMVSGYRCAMYDDALAGWARIDRKAFADGALERVESVWLNPRAASTARQLVLGDALTRS